MPPSEDIASAVAEEVLDVVVGVSQDIPHRNVDLKTGLPCPDFEGIAKTLRRHIINMLSAAGSGHPGGSLSAADIMAVLFSHFLCHRPSDPQWPERDKFILSKGHAAPILYAALAETGYFPTEELLTLRRMGSRLQGHADCKSTPGVEMSSGSLGQGLSFGVGAALAARLDSQSQRVYVLLGDGECNEGQVWEAVTAAAHFKLDNIVAIVDHNKQQSDGTIAQVMNTDPLADKWRSFGWHTIEIDGHDYEQIVRAFEQATLIKEQPTVVIAHTTKGKGVSFMENNPAYHSKPLTAEETKAALLELA
jgi:transketolase